MIGEEHLSDAFGCALRFLVDGELVGINGFVFMNASLEVPAGKIAAIGAREGAGPKTPDRRALPVAVINQAF
jgi:hypothetical protein